MNIDMNELYHFGIKGMKWGIRRYQNEDGTLTSTGKKRYAGDISKRRVKDVQRQVRSGFRSGKVNTQSINKKIINETNRTREGRAKRKADNELEEVFRSAESKGISRDRVVFDKETADAFNDISNKYNKKLKEVAMKHVDEYASTTLKSLGYEDTKAGREWLKSHNFMDW